MAGDADVAAVRIILHRHPQTDDQWWESLAALDRIAARLDAAEADLHDLRAAGWRLVLTWDDATSELTDCIREIAGLLAGTEYGYDELIDPATADAGTGAGE